MFYCALFIGAFLPLIISDIKALCEDVAVIFQLNVRFSTTMNFTELANSITDGGNVSLHSWWSSWR